MHKYLNVDFTSQHLSYKLSRTYGQMLMAFGPNQTLTRWYQDAQTVCPGLLLARERTLGYPGPGSRFDTLHVQSHKFRLLFSFRLRWSIARQDWLAGIPKQPQSPYLHTLLYLSLFLDLTFHCCICPFLCPFLFPNTQHIDSSIATSISKFNLFDVVI